MDVLSAGDAVASIDADSGARLASLSVRGMELLGGTAAAEVPPALRSGMFPMAPFAGRIADGGFEHDGRAISLPQELGGHALHGLVKDKRWSRTGPGHYECVAGAPWPVEGLARLSYELDEERLTVTLSWEGNGASPVSLGLHPWFRRRLDRGAEAELDIVASRSAVLDARGIPTGELVPSGRDIVEGCVTGLADGPRIRWPGAIRLTLTSDAPWWFVYDVEPQAFCIEPQTAPPDAPNRPEWRGEVVKSEMTATLTWREDEG